MKKTMLFLGGLVLVIFVGLYFDHLRGEKLKNTQDVKAVILNVDKANFSGHGVIVRYTVGRKVHSNRVLCDCKDLKIGDTVLIKYAVEDPELAVMVDKRYMQKYKE